MKNFPKIIGVECLECGLHTSMDFPHDAEDPREYWNHSCEVCKAEVDHEWVVVPCGTLWVHEDED